MRILFDSGFAYHILEKDLDKGKALRIIMKMKINPENIAATVDSLTHLEMLQAAGYKVALANAPSTLKEIADLVTSGEDGEGFVEATEIILLRSRKSA